MNYVLLQGPATMAVPALAALCPVLQTRQAPREGGKGPGAPAYTTCGPRWRSGGSSSRPFPVGYDYRTVNIEVQNGTEHLLRRQGA